MNELWVNELWIWGILYIIAIGSTIGISCLIMEIKHRRLKKRVENNPEELLKEVKKLFGES